MNVADSIHVLCKFLRTMYGYVRFGSLQYSFQLQQYRVGREADTTDVSLNAVTQSVVCRTDSQVKLVKTEGALDKPQIAIRIDDFLRCKSRFGDVAFYAVLYGIRFKLGVFSVAQIIQETVYLTNVI